MAGNKIILITGQTATGKTSLALKFAREDNGVIISADSRQVYRQLDIGTGKYDNPDDLTEVDGQYFLQKIPVFGLNLISADQTFSSGQFAHYARKIINSFNNKTIIIVGGTGFYIKSLIDPDQTIDIPYNLPLRENYRQLEQKLNKIQYTQKLRKDLTKVNSSKMKRMNNSDINNPRRLLRAIEVAEYLSNNSLSQNQININVEKWIGLFAPKEFLCEKIQARVIKMIENGFEIEVMTLLKNYTFDSPGMKTLGYAQWAEYMVGKISRQQLIEKIVNSHLQYARKQKIYLNRFPQITWYDVSKTNNIVN